jgi:Skp family chaperone for outer membrane proteins
LFHSPHPLSYEPEYRWWSVTILARKLLIAFVTIMFNDNPTFQATLGLAVLFSAFAAQSAVQPYLQPPKVVEQRADSAAEKAEVLREKKRRTAELAGAMKKNPATTAALVVATPTASSASKPSYKRRRPSLKRAESSFRLRLALTKEVSLR